MLTSNGVPTGSDIIDVVNPFGTESPANTPLAEVFRIVGEFCETLAV
jgi:hypothetical protein